LIDKKRTHLGAWPVEPICDALDHCIELFTFIIMECRNKSIEHRLHKLGQIEATFHRSRYDQLNVECSAARPTYAVSALYRRFD